MTHEETVARLADVAAARYAEGQGLPPESGQVRGFWVGFCKKTLFEFDAKVVTRGRLGLRSYEYCEAQQLSRKLYGIGNKQGSCAAALMRSTAKNAILSGMKPVVAKAILEHAQKWYGLSEVE